MQLHVLEGWNSFRAEVIPADASQIQVTEMRRAFYAGAVHIYHLLDTKCAAAGVNEQEGLRFLDDLSAEFRHYRNQIRKGVE